MKHLLIMFIIVQTLLSNELESLLAEYNQVSTLSKNTKKDAAGDVIVLTREDLDKMQVNTLNDVLNTMRFFTLQTSRMGGTQITKAGTSSSSTIPVKIFINSHELNNATFGNPITQYGRMNLYFIDYIEIYQAANSLSFGSESGSIVIKLYTKNPSRENGIFSQITVDTLGSSRVNFISASDIDDNYAYLMNIDIDNSKSTNHKNGIYDLNQDSQLGQVYFQLKKRDSYSLEFGSSYGVKSSFTGISMTPQDSSITGTNAYLHLEKKFADNIKLKLSSSKDITSTKHHDSLIDGVLLLDNTSAQDLEMKFHTTSTNAIVEKKFFASDNELLIALQLKYEEFDVDSFQADGISKETLLDSKNQRLVSLYGEDIYNIDEHNLLTFGLKLNSYGQDFKTSHDDDNHIIYRVGYVSRYTSWKNSLFVFNRVIRPTAGQLKFSPRKVQANPNLGNTEVFAISAGTTYSITPQTSLEANFAFFDHYNGIVVDKAKNQYVNDKTHINSTKAYVTFAHQLNYQHKLKLEAYQIFSDSNLSPSKGLLFQLFDKIWKFDMYNELVYRSSFTTKSGGAIDESYDYSLALNYPVSKKLVFKLKGENLLNKSSKTIIYEQTPPNPQTAFIEVQARERRALLSMEYSF